MRIHFGRSPRGTLSAPSQDLITLPPTRSPRLPQPLWLPYPSVRHGAIPQYSNKTGPHLISAQTPINNGPSPGVFRVRAFLYLQNLLRTYRPMETEPASNNGFNSTEQRFRTTDQVILRFSDFPAILLRPAASFATFTAILRRPPQNDGFGGVGRRKENESSTKTRNASFFHFFLFPEPALRLFFEARALGAQVRTN